MSSTTKKGIYDVAIIGSGMGGGTISYGLKDSGLRIAIIERGGFLPREEQNWDAAAVFLKNRYKSQETWQDDRGKSFSSMHYYVGGSTKVYGAALVRFRKEDFGEINHSGGVSPCWPIGYEQLEPYYSRAEKLYFVHGSADGDPFGPQRSTPLPFPPLEHEPYIEDLAQRLRKQGLQPGFLPLGVDVRPGGRCIRCSTCDGFPCRIDAKGDAEICCIEPLVQSQRVDLFTDARMHRLVTNDAGDRVIRAEGTCKGAPFEIEASTFIISCGAVNSAALLLRSANATHPAGLANSSGLVGRNYMAHLNSAILALDITRDNPTVFQKTMALNDFYFSGGTRWKFPLGSLQLLGKSQAAMLQSASPGMPHWFAKALAAHSVDWWATSEDLPDPANRVAITKTGGIQVFWKPNNLEAHHALLKTARRILRKAGYQAVFVRRMGIGANSHQCGTLRFGNDPSSSVLNALCRTHDVENLYAVDASFFPSSTAVNPALTIAAQALRVAEHLSKTLE
jgi:choline dehydrogenase-like flavoprotein